MHTIQALQSDIRLGVARGIQYGLIAEPDRFAGRARDLGAGLLQVFLYWSQIEPQPGRYDWTAVDKLLDETDTATELWLVIGSSSPWATSLATDFLPASPPTDPDAYRRMVQVLVSPCDGRVSWWQCVNEPCNAMFWAGGADDYLRHLAVFADAVRGSDPSATVVLGGCPPGVFPAADHTERERQFFDYLLRQAAEHDDAFDVHLYGDPYQIPTTISEIRAAMRGYGTQKPIVAGEYNGPIPLEYPDVTPMLADVLRSGGAAPWHRLTAAQFRAGVLSQPPARPCPAGSSAPSAGRSNPTPRNHPTDTSFCA